MTSSAKFLPPASQQQASGLDQVNGAINQMDESTQQNAAMAEETCAVAAQPRTKISIGKSRKHALWSDSGHGKHGPRG